MGGAGADYTLTNGIDRQGIYIGHYKNPWFTLIVVFKSSNVFLNYLFLQFTVY